MMACAVAGGSARLLARCSGAGAAIPRSDFGTTVAGLEFSARVFPIPIGFASAITAFGAQVFMLRRSERNVDTISMAAIAAKAARLPFAFSPRLRSGPSVPVAAFKAILFRHYCAAARKRFVADGVRKRGRTEPERIGQEQKVRTFEVLIGAEVANCENGPSAVIGVVIERSAYWSPSGA
jgi:hypothetical protein